MTKPTPSNAPDKADSESSATPLAQLLHAAAAALESDPQAAEATRRILSALGLGVSRADDVIPVSRAASELGVKPRALRDAARRGELTIEGPRSARVVRRAELSRWLREQAPAAKSAAPATEPQSDVVRSLERAAARLRRSA